MTSRPRPGRRCYRIVLGAVGALLSGWLVLSGLRDGVVPGFRRASLVLTDAAYSVASQPPRFWFIIAFWSVVCVGCIWLAWSSWRDR